MTYKPFTFVVHENDNVVRMSNPDGATVILFCAPTKAKGEAYLQFYLTLSLEDRRKLRSAFA